VILAAYGAALLASFTWLYVVSKLPLTIAFPVYIGSTFLMVVLAGYLFLAETMSIQKAMAMILILGGIALAMKSGA
jgi:multidrug transporter EmrE-like cation transporter